MPTRIEYAAHYPFNMDDDTEWLYHGPVTREEAEGFVKFVNNRARQAGSKYRASLVEREVFVGPWRLANTGVVAPNITERIDSGEGTGQGEDDRGGGAGDVGTRADDRRAAGGEDH